MDYKVGKFSFMANSRARTVDTADGMVKFLSDAKTDKVPFCSLFWAPMWFSSAGTRMPCFMAAVGLMSTADLGGAHHGAKCRGAHTR